MASMPPIAPAGSRMRLSPSCAAALSRPSSAGSASAPTEITRQSTPPRRTVSPCSATACWPATSAMTAGRRANSSSSASTMSTPLSDARACSARPGRASAPTTCTPFAGALSRSAATTSCAMPPQPISPTAVIVGRSLRIEPDAGELPLRQLLHGVAYAFAAVATRADAAERIGVEAEAARLIDPQAADPELARHLERGFEARGEAGALQPELRRVGERQCRVHVGDRLHHHHRPERLFPHEACLRRRLGDDRRSQDGALSGGLEHQLGALG